MDGEEILRIVDALHRDKGIDKELLFQSIEFAMATAARKKYDAGEELTVTVDRSTGEVVAYMEDEVADFVDLGRIGAQTAKQVMIQRIREAEQDVVMNQYVTKVGELVNGVVQRVENGNVIVNLGKGEGILPRSESIRTETYGNGDRIKALIVEVKKIGLRVRIILSRAHPDFVRRLFEVEVPEIADGVIEIKRVAREPGYRTKIAVSSYDDRVECIGACVGIRGTRIKAITEELNGEKVDIIPWSDVAEISIANALRPAAIARIKLDPGEEHSEAHVWVDEDQLSLAIGRRGQNVRLASKLTGWEINLHSMQEEQTTTTASGEDKIDVPDGVAEEGAAEGGAEQDASAAASAEGTDGDGTDGTDGAEGTEGVAGSASAQAEADSTPTGGAAADGAGAAADAQNEREVEP